METLRPAFTAAPNVKAMINIGACFDIPTGYYLYGKYGESILNAGLGNLTGISGIGNSYKSTTMHYQMLTAMARMGGDVANTYDTEINVHEARLYDLVLGIAEFNGENILDTGKWVITDKTRHTGDEWYDILKDYLQAKKKNEGAMQIETPFLDRDHKTLLKITQPSFTEVDSLSEFSTQDVIRMQDENSLGESGANMVSMRQGVQKNRFLMEIPSLAGGSYNYTLMTAHLGDEFVMDPRAPVKKKLAFLKQGWKLKGVPEKFTFVMNNCWLSVRAGLLVTNDKQPQYPRDSEDNNVGDTDLTEVDFCQLRGKSGPTGIIVTVVVSQEEGVLPSLTEFHYIKEQNRFGLEGNDRNYNLALCPEIKLSRTAVRGKIDRHLELRRALNICAEMCQMQQYWHTLEEKYRCSPKQLFDDLKALGYDWDYILTMTRGWWAPVGRHMDKNFLSTMDLLRMRTGEYIPYWMEQPPAAALQLYNSTHEAPWFYTYDPAGEAKKAKK
jgi:hypothetical protein